MTSVDDQLNADYAEAWRPDTDDQLVGEVVALGERLDFNGNPYAIVTIKQDDGTELAWHAFHAVAVTELTAARPQLGETIGVKYLGRRPNKNGRGESHVYRVAVDRPAQAFSWSKFGDQENPVGSDIPADLDPPEPAAAPTDDGVPF